MDWSKRKLRYIERHVAQFDDTAIAEALGMEELALGDARVAHNLRRTESEQAWIARHRGRKIPPYTDQMFLPLHVVCLDRRDHWIGAACALAALVVYVMTLAPTVSVLDSGELITAAYTMGIAHPPGYPLWCILGKLFTFIPIGSIAWRVNLLSAVLAALTVYVTYLLIRKLCRSRTGATSGAMALAYSALFWEQSVFAEVYSMNCLFLVLAVLALSIWYESRENKWLLVFAAAYGLGLTNHPLMQPMGPIFALFIMVVHRQPWRHLKIYFGMLGVAAATLVVYLYLPIRSSANPLADWGNPETWSGFWSLVTREDYKFEYDEHPHSFRTFVGQLWMFARNYAVQFTLWWCWVPVLGAAIMLRRDPVRMALLTGVFVMNSVVILVIVNPRLNAYYEIVNSVFFHLAYVMAAVWLGYAVSWVARSQDLGRAAKPIAWGLAIACPLFALFSHYDRNDLSDYYFTHDYGMNVLNSLEPNAIYYGDQDHVIFPPWYLNVVEGVRPDVTVMTDMLPREAPVYASISEERWSVLDDMSRPVQGELLKYWAITESGRPVYFSNYRTFTTPQIRLVLAGLVYRAVMPGMSLTPRDYWGEYDWQTLDLRDTKGELTARFILFEYHQARGRYAFAAGERAAAIAEYDRAVAIADGVPILINSVAMEARRVGLNEEAERYLRISLGHDPYPAGPWVALGSLHLDTGRIDGGIYNLEMAMRIQPSNGEAALLLAEVYLKRLRTDKALNVLRRCVESKTRMPAVYFRYGRLIVDTGGDRDRAIQQFQRALELDPQTPGLAAYLTEQGINLPASD
jgi:tetratricopeptide (TPR) repeat protein